MSLQSKLEQVENHSLNWPLRFVAGGAGIGYAASVPNLVSIVAAVALANLSVSKALSQLVPVESLAGRVVVSVAVSTLVATISAVAILSLLHLPLTAAAFLTVMGAVAAPSVAATLVEVAVAYFSSEEAGPSDPPYPQTAVETDTSHRPAAPDETARAAAPASVAVPHPAPVFAASPAAAHRPIQQASISATGQPVAYIASNHYEDSGEYWTKALRDEVYPGTKQATVDGYLAGPYRAQTARYLDKRVTQTMIQGTTVGTPRSVSGRSPGHHLEVSFVEGDLLSAARGLRNPVILSNGNPCYPAPAVERGEESVEAGLWRCTNLFQALDPSVNPQMTEKMKAAHGDPRKWGKSTQAQLERGYLIPKMGCVYSPHVQVFRRLDTGVAFENYAFLDKPWTTAVITASAFDLSHSATRTWATDPDTVANFIKQTKSKMRAVLRSAAQNGHENVVIGPFGCDGFDNDPKTISLLFGKVLAEPEFQGRFARVVFAMNLNDRPIDRASRPRSDQLQTWQNGVVQGLNGAGTVRPLSAPAAAAPASAAAAPARVSHPVSSASVAQPAAAPASAAAVSPENIVEVSVPPPLRPKRGDKPTVAVLDGALLDVASRFKNPVVVNSGNAVNYRDMDEGLRGAGLEAVLNPASNPSITDQMKKAKGADSDYAKRQLERRKFLIPKGGCIFTKLASGHAVITAAAAPLQLKQTQDRYKDDASLYEKETKETIKAIFRMAAAKGHTNVVLSPFGCKAFKNDPKKIAQWFGEVLAEPEFAGYFTNVAFAYQAGDHIGLAHTEWQRIAQQAMGVTASVATAAAPVAAAPTAAAAVAAPPAGPSKAENGTVARPNMLQRIDTLKPATVTVVDDSPLGAAQKIGSSVVLHSGNAVDPNDMDDDFKRAGLQPLLDPKTNPTITGEMKRAHGSRWSAYEKKYLDQGYLIPKDGCVFSRLSSGQAVITAAAFPLSLDRTKSWSTNKPNTYESQTKQKMRAILRTAAEKGYRNVVLSPFGCKTFKNDPKKMAQWFGEVLVEAEFLGQFDKVSFAFKASDHIGLTHAEWQTAVQGAMNSAIRDAELVKKLKLMMEAYAQAVESRHNRSVDFTQLKEWQDLYDLRAKTYWAIEEGRFHSPEGYALREVLTPIYWQTVAAVKCGYMAKGKKVDIKSQCDAMKKGTVVAVPASLGNSQRTYHTVVTLSEKESFGAAEQLGDNAVVLNMANETSPGGGAPRGALAQEEDLFRMAPLHAALMPKYNKEIAGKMEAELLRVGEILPRGEDTKSNPSDTPDLQTKKWRTKLFRGNTGHRPESERYLIPDRGAVYSPSVPVIRDGDDKAYAFKEKPFQVGVISAAALNLKNKEDKVWADRNPAEYEKLMKDKIRAIYRLAAMKGHTKLVLGQFGCGAFRNDPAKVGKWFAEVLEDSEFKGRFERVVFAMKMRPGNPKWGEWKTALESGGVTVS